MVAAYLVLRAAVAVEEQGRPGVVNVVVDHGIGGAVVELDAPSRKIVSSVLLRGIEKEVPLPLGPMSVDQEYSEPACGVLMLMSKLLVWTWIPTSHWA
ncbi:MAG: hypothetical protein RIQ78_1578 [Bacteroidota bacterium]